MTDSIALGPDGQVNHALAVMRGQTAEGALTQPLHFLPGVTLHSDPALEISGQYRSPEGRLLDLEVRPRGQGNWCALHLAMPVPDMRPYGALGFALRSSAPETYVFRACLRSGQKSGFRDCFFPKHVLVRPEESSHVDAITVFGHEDLPMRAPWRDLILFLPTKACDLSLIDLRVFLV